MKYLVALVAVLIGRFGQAQEQGAVRHQEPVYYEFQVDKAARGSTASVVPDYPRELKASAIDGHVLAEYIVDTLGHADPTSLKIRESSHELFAGAVRRVLPSMRFTPASLNGRKVRQLVRQRFTFRAQR